MARAVSSTPAMSARSGRSSSRRPAPSKKGSSPKRPRPPEPGMAGPEIKPLVWTPDLVGRFWDGVARTRGLAQQSFGRLGGRYLLQAVRWHLRPGARHLDFGGGDGDFAALLAEEGFPAAVFEPSAERAARVVERLAGRPGFLGAVGGEAVE